MAQVPWDDIVKLAQKAWGAASPKAGKKVASKVTGKKPAKAAKPKKQAAPRSKAPATKDNTLLRKVPKKVQAKPGPKKKIAAVKPTGVSQREVARREKFESMPRAGKVAKVPPAYPPKRGNVSGRRAIAVTPADKRAAEKEANRRLRMAGEKPMSRQPRDSQKAIDTKGSVPKTSKRSKSQPMGPTSSYEADIMRMLRAQDARRFK